MENISISGDQFNMLIDYYYDNVYFSAADKNDTFGLWLKDQYSIRSIKLDVSRGTYEIVYENPQSMIQFFLLFGSR